MPVASPAQPALAYEVLCTLASRLTGLGDPVVILDGTAFEARRRATARRFHLGLQHALLQDPSISGLGALQTTASGW
jgi:predicted kinase